MQGLLTGRASRNDAAAAAAAAVKGGKEVKGMIELLTHKPKA